jgi:hypothetical protein
MWYRENVLFSELLEERSGFYQGVIWEEKHSFELKILGYKKDYMIYY